MAPQVLVVGTLFVLMGLSALARPEFIVGFFGATVETPDFRNEIRAVYGGFGVLLGSLLLMTGTLFAAHSAGIFIACAAALFGMAAGRLLSFTMERTGAWPVFYCAVELIGGSLLVSAVP